MRVAVVYPEAVDLARFKEGRKEFPPFGALYLAAEIEKGGHEVGVFKLTESSYEFDFTKFDAICFSIASSATFDLFKICRSVSRMSSSDQLLLAGGVHAHFFAEDVLFELEVHAVCYAEADEIILPLLESGNDKVKLSAIGNLVFLDGTGAVKRTQKLEVPRYIDDLPLPARHLFPTDDLILKDRLAGTDLRMAHAMFTRGCPFSCQYCAVAQTKMQYRSGVSCAAELETMKRNYDIEGFAIVDDNFIISRKVVYEICKEIEPLGLKWSALSRVDVVRPHLLEAMADAGCLEIKYGVESGDETLLKYMQKNTTIDQISSALKHTASAGIRNKVFIVHGFPGENLKTTQATIELLDTHAELISRVSVFRFVPLPGTGSYNSWRDYGIVGTNAKNGWSGRWSDFHIHHNERHWWGEANDFLELQKAFQLLSDYVERNWPERHEL